MKECPYTGEVLDVGDEFAGPPPPDSQPHVELHEQTVLARRKLLDARQERGIAQSADDDPSSLLEGAKVAT
jgi:hypothetical protein